MSRIRVCTVVVLIAAATALGSVIQVGPRLYEVTESRVNTTTSNTQQYPAIGLLTDGTYIVGWESWFQGLHGADCFGQRFSAAGAPLGSELLLNPYNNSGWEYGPEFGPLPGGGFAVVWGDSSSHVCVQLFDDSMNPIGSDSVVAYNNVWPTISSAPSGDFVVAGGRALYSGNMVFARRYNSSGVAYGPVWQVNTDPIGFSQYAECLSSVAHAPDGRFLIAWFHGGGDIRAQLYDASGGALSGEFTVNSSTGGARRYPTVEFTSSSDFVIAWEGYGQGDEDGIFARAFSADGLALCDEWRVNQVTSGAQSVPQLGASPTGEFVISWSAQSDDGSDIFARLFAAAADPIGDEFQVNQFSAGDQFTRHFGGRASAAIGGDTLLLSWYGNTPGDTEGIGLTQFRYAGEIPEPATAAVFGIAVAAVLRRKRRRT